MTTLINALKSEITRLARKELKNDVLALRKAVTLQRSEIAALKREIKALQSQVKSNQKTLQTVQPAVPTEDEMPRRALRFSAERFAAQRAKLGLSQAQLAQLVGASTLSISKWETGKVRPRAAQLERIAAIRKLGKREAMARLAATES